MPSDDLPQAPIIDPDERPPSSVSRGSRARGKRSLLARLLPVMIVVVALGGFASLVGYYYMAEAPNGAAPLIKADQQPFKVKPDNPGGMAVPDQDKEIYDRMGHDQSSVPPPNTERLLPPPETPLPRPAAAPSPPANAVASAPAPVLPGTTVAPPPASQANPGASPNTNPNVGGPVLGTPQSPRASTLAAAPPGAPAAPASPPPKPAPAAPAAKALAPTQTAAVAPRPAPTKATPAAAGGPLLRAAIASLRTEAEAKREWERQRHLYPEALARVTPAYASINLGAKGVYWRIYVGPAEPNAEARARCAALKEKKVDCFVARP